jgi:hypothetical protein
VNGVLTGAGIGWYGNPNQAQQQFFNFQDIEAGPAPALYSPGGNGKWYVNGGGAGKMSNHSTTNAVIFIGLPSGGQTASTNNIWIGGFGKVTSNNGGGWIYYNQLAWVGQALGNFTNTGNCFYQSAEWEEKTTTYHVGFNLITGTHSFGATAKPVIMPNGRIFQISNAVVTVNGMTMDATGFGSSSNNCIFIQGSAATNLVTLNNCTLISSNGVNAINATNAQTVYVSSTRISGAISTNITMRGIWYSNAASGTSDLYVDMTKK